jgi:hypothetical protein
MSTHIERLGERATSAYCYAAKVLGMPVTVPNDRWSVERQQLPPRGRADLV